jgi:phosphoglycerate dehydrogenase-like enzyme
MRKEFKIALAWHAGKKDLALYRGFVASHCKILNPRSSEEKDLIAVARKADAIVGSYIPQKMIEAAAKVKMVQILHAGVATDFPGDAELGFRTEYLAQRGILMGNIHGNSLAVAEHAMCFILACAKQLIPANIAVATGAWFPVTEENKSYMLCDSTLGIVGLGHIGGEVVKRAKAFNMRVIGIARHSGSERLKGLGLDFVGSPDDLPTILKESDFVLLTIPLTKETYNLIGEKELKMMKPDAYLINVARSNLVNEPAIHKALTENWIKGYASDVWWFYSCAGSTSKDEPWFNFGFHYNVPSRLEVNRLPNVIGTGDRAAFTKGVIHSFIEDGLRNIDQFAGGHKPKNVVNLELGY